MNPRRKHFVALNKVKKNTVGKLALSFLKKICVELFLFNKYCKKKAK